jgi:hypothetical protein
MISYTAIKPLHFPSLIKPKYLFPFIIRNRFFFFLSIKTRAVQRISAHISSFTFSLVLRNNNILPANEIRVEIDGTT